MKTEQLANSNWQLAKATAFTTKYTKEHKGGSNPRQSRVKSLKCTPIWDVLGWLSLNPTPNWDDLGYMGRGGGAERLDRVIRTSGNPVIGKAKPLKPTPIWDGLG